MPSHNFCHPGSYLHKHPQSKHEVGQVVLMSPSFSVNSRLLGNLGVTYLGISYLGGRNPNYLEQVALPN